MIEANWLIFAIALVVAIILAFWLFGRAGKPKVRDHRPDVLDEGAAPAQRNQALIDAPSAAAYMPPPQVPPVVVPPVVAPPAAGTLAGVGEVIARGAQQEAEAVPTHEAAPIAEPAPAPAEPPLAAMPEAQERAAGDDLRRIKGIGPKLVATLHALGITRYAQIAGWTDADLDALDPKLGAFAGRPRRDAWIEQAQLLAGGDTAAYEARFGRL